MSKILRLFTYSQTATKKECGSLNAFIEDYAGLVRHEKGETNVRDKTIINMDKCAEKVDANQRPPSMDFAMAVKPRAPLAGQEIFMLVDCKFGMKDPEKVRKRIRSEEIKKKFFGSKIQIEKCCSLPCCDVAFFLFKDEYFEQARSVWARRTTADPKNRAIKISDFETLFAP